MEKYDIHQIRYAIIKAVENLLGVGEGVIRLENYVYVADKYPIYTCFDRHDKLYMITVDFDPDDNKYSFEIYDEYNKFPPEESAGTFNTSMLYESYKEGNSGGLFGAFKCLYDRF